MMDTSCTLKLLIGKHDHAQLTNIRSMTKRYRVLTAGRQLDFQPIQNTSLSIQFGFHHEQPAQITSLRQHVHVATLICW